MLVIFFWLHEYIKLMKIKLITKPQIFFVKNQTLQQIANQFGVSADAIKKLNNITNVTEGDIIALPQENFYVVKPADTLNKICALLGVPKHELMQKNNIKTVFIGQILRY